ncbi:hypothetical protein B0H17DRAFT_1074631 [Mycena rosella]|uniref:F-box domain-containing protein n=1 Tax=Mycena rosella TaxID=1033263 RepID=A0AAD7D7E9_MYCRO|nr:hypothetical protein B0H17DRAFT_1074631 [Mycena rosella]
MAATTTELARLLSLPLDPAVLLGERATLLRAIAALDTRRNQLAPISKLCPELLSEIFLVIAAYSRVSADHPGYLSAAEVRTCTMGVCHQWRYVALGCTRLWSYIDFSWDSREKVKNCLLHSKSTPLVVQASLHRPLGLANVLLALEDMCRIQCLDLGFSPSHFDSFEHFLLPPAPALEVLRLNCDSSSVRLPPEIFACETPRLRELELRGCAIPEDSHLLRNLTYLSVDGTPLDCAFPAFRWLEILDSLPLLQVLSLSQSFSLALEGCMEDCSDMLGHISFPPTPCLEIKQDSDKLPATQRLRSLGISWRADGHKFRASTDETGDVSPESSGSEFCLAFAREPLAFPLLLAVLDALPTSDITVLDLATPLCHCPPPSHWVFRVAEDWTGPLHRFIAVHTLRRIQYDWAGAVLDLLVPAFALPRVDASAVPVLLPALHTLEFVNTAFDIPAIVPNLMDLLRWRTENGKPIRTISAYFCKNVLSKVRMLEDAGVEVKWDGNARFEGEEDDSDPPVVPRTRRMGAH